MMKSSLIATLILGSALAITGVSASAQQAPQQGAAAQQAGTEQNIQMLREDLRSQKKQIIAANMQLTDAEATKFWPVYDQYSAESTKIGDARQALIKEYAQNYNTLTDAQAKALIKQGTAIDQQVLSLRTQYIPKFEAVLPGKKAALFFQMDRRLALLMDLQLAALIPMVQQ
jgi:hypothetical protein